MISNALQYLWHALALYNIYNCFRCQGGKKGWNASKDRCVRPVFTIIQIFLQRLDLAQMVIASNLLFDLGLNCCYTDTFGFVYAHLGSVPYSRGKDTVCIWPIP
jgi:hypothetical protein